MNRVHFLAGESHFLDHLVPLWMAIPEECRGGIYLGDADHRRREVAHRAAMMSELPELERKPYPPKGNDSLTVVAAIGDLKRLLRWRPSTRVGFVEHGCGITYNGDHASYVGSSDRPNVEVILTPRTELAQRQLMATPHIDVQAIGDEPKMDKFRGASMETSNERPIICFAFHWDARVVPETRSALYWYRPHLTRFVTRNPQWKIVGHAHPRMAPMFRDICRHTGMEYIEDLEEVLRVSDCLCMDNSSVLYEFASLDRPVVVMNCPLYRKHVNHGNGRFWDTIPGIQIDDPHLLTDVITEALADPRPWPAERRRATDRFFPHPDGYSARRGARILLEHI